ncbi:MAG: hypothetical protein AB1554_11895 [Chloroflexota bacterium]
MSSYDILIENAKPIGTVSNRDVQSAQHAQNSLWRRLLERLSKLDLSPTWGHPAAEERHEVLMVMDVRKMIL